jgi:type II secretory pathway component PulJ
MPHPRYNPSVPPVRPQRMIEGWMVLAVVLGLAIGSSGLVLKYVIVPAFAKVNATLAMTQTPGAR